MKVLKFGAVWCPGCLVMKPRWKKIEEENSWLKTEYYDLDADIAKKVAEKYNIKMLPTFIFLDSKENEILRLNGEVDEKKLIELINQNKDK